MKIAKNKKQNLNKTQLQLAAMRMETMTMALRMTNAI